MRPLPSGSQGTSKPASSVVAFTGITVVPAVVSAAACEGAVVVSAAACEGAAVVSDLSSSSSMIAIKRLSVVTTRVVMSCVVVTSCVVDGTDAAADA